MRLHVLIRDVVFIIFQSLIVRLLFSLIRIFYRQIRLEVIDSRAMAINFLNGLASKKRNHLGVSGVTHDGHNLFATPLIDPADKCNDSIKFN